MIHIDGKARTNHKFPLGLMDVLSIPKIKRSYRSLIDVKGRFVTLPIS